MDFKLRDDGKSHERGNPKCPACDQKNLNGEPLMEGVRRFPYVDSSGNPPCGGLVHAEVFGNERVGWAQCVHLR